MYTHTFGAVEGNRLAAVYDVLVWSDPATGTVQPHIAEALTPRENGTAWTLRLRPGITFSDGTPFDAEAVRFNWERHRDSTNHSLQLPATADISSLRATDPLTLQIQLRRSNANFDRTVARHLAFLVSPTAVRRDPVGVGRRPVGAGPYLLAEWARDGRQVFTRNPGYWQTARSLPRFESITMSVVGDATDAVNDVGSEHLDAAVVFAPAAITRAAERRLAVQQIHLDGGA
ncbi:ABC transporter substrate-binding protein, partial [Yinghuangia sp. YIM S10712]|uniref:ABC transporter substrate-binding protein n=1 Tax=Yinghuangia sp. YIM S10712 TaxID=3436930 RepID=UPI003F52AE51